MPGDNDGSTNTARQAGSSLSTRCHELRGVREIGSGVQSGPAKLRLDHPPKSTVAHSAAAWLPIGAGWSQYAIRVPAAFVSLVPFAVSKRSFASFDPRADRQGVDLPVWCQKRKRAETMHCCGNRSQVDHHGPRSCSRHQQVFWQLSSLAEIAHDFGQGPQSAA